ncbi:cation:proton antiporter domain-containing protein [Algisphaera agarilytica]|uniref:Kef-type K+ transport system membrane component KefB n=1 Tax=Algisphaera agarilytica TaxID=1385975 RepID=A0A7X0H5B6_9BACT|nr:cation:proton antiporter [Algisphaera agarilytica]MBB6428406.1 Kef-type K+ transport system membrane component KefB [Algisphaera agarilytica]
MMLPLPTLAAGALSYEQITVFLLAFGVLLGTARLFGEIARKFGQPTVLGEILAGVVLGATVLGNPAILGEDGVNVQFYEWLFPTYELEADGDPVEYITLDQADVESDNIRSSAIETDPPTYTLDERDVAGAKQKYDGGFLSMSMFLNLAAVFLLLVAGLEVDLSIVWKQGKAALWVSLMGMVVPFAFGFGLAYAIPEVIGYDPASDLQFPFALFLGIAMSITALPVIAKILMDLNMFRSDMGMLIMSSAMVNDLLGWVGFAMVLALVAGAATVGADAAGAAAGGSATTDLLVTVGWTLLFVGGMLTVGRWLIHKVLPTIQANTSWPGGVLGFVLTVALISAAATEAIGIHSIFGAFIAGVAIGDSKHLRAKTRETIEQFINNIFAPLFFAGIGLRVNFIEGFDFAAVAIVLVIAILGKVIGCYFGALWAGLSKRESAAIGMGMSARGAMEIILGQLALNHGLITEKLFVAIVVMAIATSLIAGPAMQVILRQKQKRRLEAFLSDKNFAGQLKSSTRKAAIRELSEIAAASSGLGVEQINHEVWQRELMMSTGLPHGVAVPHARMAGLDKPIVVIGQSNAGVDFDSSDGQLAEIICLILTPEEDGEVQLELLSAVAEAFSTEGARRECLEAVNFTEFKAALITNTDHHAAH